MEGNTRERGSRYEKAAAEYLRKKGYTVLDTNFYTRGGEIDIIAKKDDTLCFIEVKARKKKTGMSPFEAVDKRKQKRIISAARTYILKNEMHKNYIRFDVAGVFVDNEGNSDIELLEDAFGE